jgi:hypothetical protein
MKTVVRRIVRLEDTLRFADGKDRLIVVVHRLDRELSLDSATYLGILREAGPLPAVIRLDRFPKGLSAEETKMYLREHGAEICGARQPQNHSGPAGLKQRE